MSKSLSFLFLIAISLPLSAQDKDKSRGIQLRGLAFSLFEDIDTLELRKEGKLLTELILPTGQLKERTSVSARQFSFGVTRDETFRSLGQVTLPEAGKDFILVFAPTREGYRAFPVNTDDPDFRGDDTYLFNFTQHRIGAMLGTSKNVVEPWKSARLRPKFAAEATFYRALFAYEKDGTFTQFHKTRWRINPNTKALLFVYENPETGRLTYRSVTELAEPE